MDFNRKLIEFVRLHNCIYDTNDPHYTDNFRKREAWKDISRRLHVPEDDCKKSWILLREGYRRAVKKNKRAQSDPVFRKDKETRKWAYEDDLSFLFEHLKQLSFFRPTNNDNEDNHTKMTNQSSTPAANSNETVQKRALIKKSRTQEASTRRPCSHEATASNLKYVLEKTTKRSEIQQFFDSIACTVQTFSPRDRAVAKRKVFEVISQMEMEILDQKPALSFQSNGSPESNDMEVTESRSGLYATPPPEATTSGLFECNNSNNEDSELVMDIKVEPEQFVAMNIKQEPYT